MVSCPLTRKPLAVRVILLLVKERRGCSLAEKYFLLRKCLLRNQLLVSIVSVATDPAITAVSIVFKSIPPVNLKSLNSPSTS